MKNRTVVALAGIALLLIAPVVSAAHSVKVTSATPQPGTYTMNVAVDKFQLVDFTGKSAKKGEGHIHYLVNDKDACSAGKATCAAPTDYATTRTSFAFKDLKAGDVLRAELVLSDHSASGTDASGNLNGARVPSQEVKVGGNDAPAAGVLLALALVGAAALVLRRT